MPDEIDTTNKWAVGANHFGITIMFPPRSPLSNEDALLLAAYLVALSTNSQEEFLAVLKAVENA